MGVREFLSRTRKSELFRSSMILLMLLNIGNFLNYIFHFSMARMLGPVDYGILAVLTNILYIFNAPTMSIQTVVSKYTTRFFVKKDFGRINGILKFVIKKSLYVSFIIFIIFSIFSIFLSNILNIPVWLLILTGVFLFGAFIYPAITGVLQGMKKFKVWGWNFIANCLIKLFVSIILVLIGFRVYGAIIGFILGPALAFFIVLPFIKEVIGSKRIDEKIDFLSEDSISTFMVMLLITLMFSLDVILVKVFFPADITGKYAVLSMIGKIILFGTMTIGNAMFPISSEKFIIGGRPREVFKKTFIITFFISALVVALFALFPGLIVKILFGSQYLSLTNMLVYVGVSFSFISFINLFILYKISVDKFKLKHIGILILFLIVQIVILFLLHDSIEEFSLAFMFSTIITFIGSLILIKK